MALVAASERDMQALLTTAEQHSLRLHYRFNVQKCEGLVPAGSSLTLCQSAIPIKERVVYLGVVFDHNGIAKEQHLTRRLHAADRAKESLCSIGLRGNCFPTRVSCRLVQAFIMPSLDYAFGILPWTKALGSKYNSVVARALKRALSLPQSTSTAALPLLSLLQEEVIRAW
ncbi:hypothetical protein RI367_008227 [Sorochytrium milnesiophthora]